MKYGRLFGLVLVVCLLAFEIFNYSTTEFALKDLFGNLSLVGISWSTIIAIAFCGIDFAGIARLFTPEQGRDEPAEVWYLFGAWILAAAMNATLTWWGISVAITNHGSFVGQVTTINAVAVFIAAAVFVIRLLIIGTFATKDDRLFASK